MPTLAPCTEAETLDAVRWALSAGQPLAVMGKDSKSGLGRPAITDHVLTTASLSRCLSYEPDELIMVAEPGLSMSDLTAMLAGNGQGLAFEPPDLGPLFGKASGVGTLGGIVGCGLSGPARIKAGAVRDHVLGITAVSGSGERFRSGGRVVKNVTGYDLPKLLTGTHGTLGVMTDIVVKVLPAPPVSRTLILAGIDGADATHAMADALGSAAEISGAAWVPALPAFPHLPSRTPCVLLRVEGVAVSVAARLAGLETLLAGRAAMAVLDIDETRQLWVELRDAAPLAARPELNVWRLSVPPTDGMAVLDRIRTAIPRSLGWLDWGGGLIWTGLPGGLPDAGAALVRGAIRGGGHATLIRAPDAVRATIPVFQPQSPGLAALSERVRAQFDPHGILNPGRMGG